MEGDDGCVTTTIKLNVKFSGRSIPLEIPNGSTVKHLKSLLQPLTNVLPRGQKLIFKGKVMLDDVTLDLPHGSKIMLVASHGLHQGDGPIRTQTPTVRRLPETKRDTPLVKTQLERWKATGVVALSESNMTALPDEVLTCGPSARVLDLSYNSIQYLPDAISGLSSLQKLILDANEIMDNSLSWEGLASLKNLVVLSLNQNNIATVPPAVGALTSLRQLHIAHNKLAGLPSEIGLLTGLEVLKVNNNRIDTVPENIGGCASLIEVDLSSNLLVELPQTIGNLKDLKALYLGNNGLKSLPSIIFKLCGELSILDLHGTEITMDVLRQFEGWENFDERRRSKHQKQLDFRVSSSAKFDEGADKS